MPVHWWWCTFLGTFVYSLPWDQTTPPGYWGFIVYSAFSGLSYLLFNGAILLFFISICWYHQAFYEQFCDLISKLNDQHRNQDSKTIVCDLIRFHIRVKRYKYSFKKTRDKIKKQKTEIKISSQLVRGNGRCV